MELDVAKEEDSEDEFLLSLQPVLLDSLDSQFSKDPARKLCLQDHNRNLTQLDLYNIDNEYKNFMRCVRTGEGLEARMRQMEKATRQLATMKHLTSNVSETLIQHTTTKTREFLEDLYQVLPYTQELKEDLKNINCDTVDISNLHSEIDNEKIIEWERMIKDLLNTNDVLRIQVYKKKTIQAIVSVLKKFYDESQATLNNILVMLWSERLYTDFVNPIDGNVGKKEYCLSTVIALMPDKASSVYIKAMPEYEIKARKQQFQIIIEEIKWRGETEIKKVYDGEWAIKNVISMMDTLKSQYDEDPVSDPHDTTRQIHITGNFLQNVLKLLKNRWTLVEDTYINKRPPTETPWLFIRPYNSYGVYNYILNKIMIPYGAVEPFSTFENMPDYLKYAKLGTMISSLLWHGFDETGLAFNSESGKELAELDSNKLWNQFKQRYEAPQNSSIPGTPKAIFSINYSSLKEIWANSQGISLAWSTYFHRNDPKPTSARVQVYRNETTSSHARRRRRSTSAIDEGTKDLPLPYLELSHMKLFYLYWAQQYCSEGDQLSMLELKESIHPPGRIRVNFALANNDFFQEAFECSG